MKKIVYIATVAIALLLNGCGGGNIENDIYKKVVDDTLKQYEITKKGGNQIDICVHAGMVKAAYLQAKDETNYQKWNEIEKQDCKDAMP